MAKDRVVLSETLGGFKVEFESPSNSDGVFVYGNPLDREFASQGHYFNGEPHNNRIPAEKYARELARRTGASLKVYVSPGNWTTEEEVK